MNPRQQRASERTILGILTGSLDDLEKGFLVGQELLIAGEMFDSFLEQATHLLEGGFKAPAAVIGRVVLENGLRRLSEEEKLNSSAKPSALNDALLKAKRYSKPRWRQLQYWLDIGNAAAHGQSDSFSAHDVAAMLQGIRDFLAQSLGP